MAAPTFEPAPALARIAAPEVLELKLLDERHWILRAPDGVFVQVAAPDPDARWGTPPATYHRRMLGTVSSELVLVDTCIAEGRIRTRIAVRAPDGAERSTDDFINTSAHSLDAAGARVVMTAEHDRMPALIAVELSTLAATRLRAFPIGDAPSETLAFRGELYGLVRDRMRTRLVRYAGAVDPCAELLGSLELTTRIGELIDALPEAAAPEPGHPTPARVAPGVGQPADTPDRHPGEGGPLSAIERLDEIPGIGPSRKRALLHTFGSAKAIARAALADLEKTPGVNAATAKLVYDFFHDAGRGT